MTMLEAAKICFRKGFTFSGRATRSEFWKFILFILLGSIALIILNSAIFGPTITVSYNVDSLGNPIGDPIAIRKQYSGGIFGTIFLLICALPWITAGWRRMHDMGKPGYLPYLPLLGWWLIMFLILLAHTGVSGFFSEYAQQGHVQVPVSGYLAGAMIVAFIIVLILNIHWLATPSEPTTNKYGPNPSEVIQ
ncbi:DUF805 domain-containing protein [Halocynthiibacter styelae]|uniref:DUF805 domain-containing protein n=1 Tax=Halocynthiibacter styelae TaxID=2761955 RepID=A0A8J7LPF5_9RHOB|nr:DUF805 domain-containing protein [Paenihalocynthiibacter styelae]MBI1492752.1 DUF805 domain-containing protein [Paenihalocynthiibacter styelae]